MDMMRYPNRIEPDEQGRYSSLVIYDCEGVDEAVMYEPLRGATAADASNAVGPTASRNSDALDGFNDEENTADRFNNITDELNLRGTSGDKQQYRKAAADEDGYAGSSEDWYNDTGTTADRCNCIEGHSYTGATADDNTEESEDKHTHREEEYTYRGHISRGNNCMTTSTNEHSYMRTFAPLHNDRGEIAHKYNYIGASADGHKTGNKTKPHNCRGTVVDWCSHMRERDAHNHMGVTANSNNDVTNTMEGHNDAEPCTDGFNYMGATAGGRNYMETNTQRHAAHTTKPFSDWRSSMNAEASAEGDNHTFFGLDNIRDTVDGLNGIGATGDCRNSTEVKVVGGHISARIPRMMPHSEQEIWSGVTSEETIVAYRQAESDLDCEDDPPSYDCLGITEDDSEGYEVEGATADGYTSEGPVPPVMLEILDEMPPGQTADDILKTCVDDQTTQSESTDESSGYLTHEI